MNSFEVQLGIICACIPTLIPFYKWVRKRFDVKRKFTVTQYMLPVPPPEYADEIAARRRKEAHKRGKEPPQTSRTEDAVLGRYLKDIPDEDLEARPHVRTNRSASRSTLINDGLKSPGQAHIPLQPYKGDNAVLPVISDRSDSGTSYPLSDYSTRYTSEGDNSLAKLRNASGDRKASLEVDLQPNFQEHRSLWSRMMGGLRGTRGTNNASMWRSLADDDAEKSRR